MADSASLEKPDFDFECVLESCTLEEENLEDILQKNDALEILYKEKYDAFLKLKLENKMKKRHLVNLKLSNLQLMQKVNFTANNFDEINTDIRTAQENTKQNFIEGHKHLKDFTKKTSRADGYLEKLQSQFDEKTLESQINYIELKLQAAKTKEEFLFNRTETLKNKITIINEYERSPMFKTMVDEFKVDDNIAETNKKLVEQEKNLRFLKNEIEKQKEVLMSLE